jgi:Flp pilus assembly protein TadG
MTKPRIEDFRGLIADCGGAEIAEAAAVLPIMFMMLLGIFWFGQAFSIYGAITRAAQDGARAGSLPYCATCTGTNTLDVYATHAANAIQNDLLVSKLDPNLAQWPSTVPSLTSCVGGTAVTCNASASNDFCIQSPIQLMNSGLGTTGLCGISVTFRYPYRFWLPFTSLNKQIIWISASAQVKMETR